MRSRLIIAVGVLVLLVAACGGGGDDDGADDTPAATQAPATAASGGGSAEAGLELYAGTCTACHAEGGVGVEGLGKPLADSAFVQSQTDAELVAFITVGRPTSDPENTSGVDMPPKGGNPALSEEDIQDIVAYVRTLNE